MLSVYIHSSWWRGKEKTDFDSVNRVTQVGVINTVPGSRLVSLNGKGDIAEEHLGR